MSNFDEEEIIVTDSTVAAAVEEPESQVDPYFDPDSDLNDFTFEDDVSLDKAEDEEESF